MLLHNQGGCPPCKARCCFLVKLAILILLWLFIALTLRALKRDSATPSATVLAAPAVAAPQGGPDPTVAPNADGRRNQRNKAPLSELVVTNGPQRGQTIDLTVAIRSVRRTSVVVHTCPQQRLRFIPSRTVHPQRKRLVRGRPGIAQRDIPQRTTHRPARNPHPRRCHPRRPNHTARAVGRDH